MDGFRQVEQHVAEGRVLDENGLWIPLARKIALEQEFLKHLERGEVLFDKKWISLEQRKALEKQGVTAAAPHRPPTAHGGSALTLSDVRRIVGASEGEPPASSRGLVTKVSVIAGAAALVAILVVILRLLL